VFIDQHLLVRGRFARMLPAMLKKGYKLGLGIDEDTAMVVLPNVHINQVLAGFLWGEVLAVLLAGGMVGPLSGIGFMGMKTSNPRFALTNLLMHAVWGVVIGALYVAP